MNTPQNEFIEKIIGKTADGRPNARFTVDRLPASGLTPWETLAKSKKKKFKNDLISEIDDLIKNLENEKEEIKIKLKILNEG
jgi:hypothetical protein